MNWLPAFRRRTKAKHRLDGRWKLLLWATVISLICGAIELGEPVEKFMRQVRNGLRAQDASDGIVVVGIDDKSLAAVGQWPWPRRYSAQMLDNLLAKGAKRVFFDYNLTGRSNPADDALLTAALDRAGKRAVLASRLVIDPVTGQRAEAMPLPRFSHNAQIGNINVFRDAWGSAWTMPYQMGLSQDIYPSFAVLLAEKQNKRPGVFPIDYSFKYRSVPTLSASAVIGGDFATQKIRGRDVIIGLTSDRLGDVYAIPGQWLGPGVYLHVLGAETLKRGDPVALGWFPAFLIALLSGVVYSLWTRRSWLRVVLPLFGSFLIIPVLLEANLIFIDIFPAVILLLMIVSGRVWRQIKEKGATTNVSSGLPNLNALRQSQRALQDARSLVAARIRNYSEIVAALPPGDEEVLISEVTRRLELGIAGAQLFQGEEGVFVWLARAGAISTLGDEIEGLHAILTGPVAVGGRQIDLSVSFGVDHNTDRDLNNRLGSALLAADEAALENLRWKTYDPARLRDAEWKLSLLGRLDTAIDEGEIWVAYQPKLDVRTGRITGAEALARWLHPEKGPIAPDDFIQAAEQHNRIEKLTIHILQEAVKAAAAVNAHGIPFNVAVNLSARVLESPHLCELIEELIAAHRLPPGMLTLEITESAAIIDNGHSVAMLETFRSWGIGVAIDDYGTGFSTLEYLRNIPSTEIKIDKSFVAAMERSQGDRLMVASTIQLAHSLGRTVVAEGVETEATLRLLEEMGCDSAQGYLIGRPMKFIGLSRMLVGEQRRRAA